MKRKFHFLIVLILLLILWGCSPAPAETPTTEDTTPETTEAAPQYPALSQEQAMLEGYVVMVDGDVRYNQHNFITFEKTARQGIPVSVKLTHYNQGENGGECILYDLRFDGTEYLLTTGGEAQTYHHLLQDMRSLDEHQGLYDSVLRYTLVSALDVTDPTSLTVYQDLIAEPDLTGVAEITFHLKEGEPPLETYSAPADVEAILELLSSADYLTAPPEEYLYGAKLIMVNGEGKELVIELELNEPILRYGMQHYEYFRLFDLFTVLDIPGWPDEVWAEYDIGQE